MKWIITSCLLLIIVVLCLIFLFMGSPLKIEPNTELSFDLPLPVKQAIYHASLAPSTHNAQMWQVWIEKPESRLYIVLDQKRLLPQVDSLSREAYISLGAFVENLRQSLVAFGYQVQVSVEQHNDAIPDSQNVVVVNYDLSEQIVEQPEVIALFSLRHSDKRPFLDQPLEPLAIRELIQVEPTQIFYFAKNETLHEYLRSNALLAYQQQMNDQQKRDELAQWFRFSDEEARAAADGLSAEQMGLSGIKKALYYLFINREAAMEDSFVRQGLDIFQKQLDNSVGFFIITGNNSPEEWIKTGMLMQSFWLFATKEQIALHPFSQILEEEPFKSQIQGELELQLPVQMIFRAGYVHDYGQNHGIRRPLSDFVFQLMPLP